MIEIVENKLWVQRMKLTFFGLEIGTRMTVIRLAGDSLFIHSPISLDIKLKQELDRIGRVDFVVSPNKMHHFFIADYMQGYPAALVFASPGLPEKRKDVAFKYLLKDNPENQWAHYLGQKIFYCGEDFREVVFFHRETRTLIVADLIMNFRENTAFLTKLVLKVVGSYNKPISPVDTGLTANQKAMAAASLEYILGWDFDRIILAHGDIIETGGKKVLSELFFWLN